jgi:hypothetical protein
MKDDGQRELDQAFDELEQEGCERVARAIRWLRSPASRRVRMPLGVLLIAGGVVWFLPVVGLEMIPLGIMIIAQDVPFLKKPVARGVLWLLRRWQALRRRYEERKRGFEVGTLGGEPVPNGYAPAV